MQKVFFARHMSSRPSGTRDIYIFPVLCNLEIALLSCLHRMPGVQLCLHLVHGFCPWLLCMICKAKQCSPTRLQASCTLVTEL